MRREETALEAEQGPALPPPAYHQPNNQSYPPPPNGGGDDFESIPTNHVSVTDVNSISGVWTIDTSWVPPRNAFGADFSVPFHGDESRNITLQSESGSIEAKIRLVGDNQDAAVFNLETKNSDINVSVVSRWNQQPFVLYVTSTSGNLEIRVPRDFHGSIIHETASSTYTTFSPGVNPHRTTISMINGSGKTFVARHKEGDTKRQSASEWTGDRIVAKTERGCIYFAYEDEPQRSVIGAFFRKLFG
ncbi:uncharacterized protein EI90DRAFT_3150200 [Cantharellus anzutake]|uniref:uncharacterized protein n=1 Tax=Cantharellus anzutake TaxID=1750568 RepID=UPI001906E5A3|nr:uncharacterized protein EI90DRAFT_3150200 [Cantharellus anzutake]KAF8342050.1 hypothetical protein EI90DRAFT_3150200 [Cantharellus anzutake]